MYIYVYAYKYVYICMYIHIHTYSSILSSVPFAGPRLFAGLKLAGLNPAKCHARMPRKKN